MIKKKLTIKESSKKFFDMYFEDAMKKYKDDITPGMTLKDFCRFLDENNYSSRLSYVKLYRQEPNIDMFIEEFEKAKESISKKVESLKSYLQKKLPINSKEAELIEFITKEYSKKNKVKEAFPVNAYFDDYLKVAIDEYADYIEPDMTLKEFCEILDMKGLEPVSDISYTFIYEIEKNNKRFDAIERKFEKAKESISRKEESLKSYLQKRLTINSKEAQLIESTIREYVRKRK